MAYVSTLNRITKCINNPVHDIQYMFCLWDSFLGLKLYKFLSDFICCTSVITSRKLILIDSELGSG